MKKLIALATLLVLVVVLAVPVTAVNYAPDRPPWRFERQPDDTPSGDDIGWGEPERAPTGIATMRWDILTSLGSIPGGATFIVLWAVNVFNDSEDDVCTDIDITAGDRTTNTK